MSRATRLSEDEKRLITAAFHANEHYAAVAKRIGRDPTTTNQFYMRLKADGAHQRQPWKPGNPKPQGANR